MIGATIFLPFYFEWDEMLSPLSDDDYGKLMRAVVQYARSREQSEKLDEMSPMAAMAYRFIISCIERSDKKRLAGKKGGIARARSAKNSQNKEKGGNIIENDVLSPQTADNSRYNDENNPKIEEKRDKIPTPSSEEVRNFFKSRGFRSNPDEFYNFYSSNGWMVGKTPMQNWYSSAENWEIKANRPTSNVENYQNTDSYHHYEPKKFDIDANEAFRLALARSYDFDAEDE